MFLCQWISIFIWQNLSFKRKQFYYAQTRQYNRSCSKLVLYQWGPFIRPKATNYPWKFRDCNHRLLRLAILDIWTTVCTLQFYRHYPQPCLLNCLQSVVVPICLDSHMSSAGSVNQHLVMKAPSIGATGTPCIIK